MPRLAQAPKAGVRNMGQVRGDEFLFLSVFHPVLEHARRRSCFAGTPLPLDTVYPAAMFTQVALLVMPPSTLKSIFR